MKQDKKCPVCGKEMETWHDTLDGWCLLEDYIGCSDGCYIYYYYTGTTEITIMNKTFSFYHTLPYEEKEKVIKEAHTYLDEVIKNDKAKG